MPVVGYFLVRLTGFATISFVNFINREVSSDITFQDSISYYSIKVKFNLIDFDGSFQLMLIDWGLCFC